jgi:hypothetical protein
MNGLAVELLMRLYRADPKILESDEAKFAKERVRARRGRESQFGTKYMKEEIMLWKFLADKHGLKPNALLMWAFEMRGLLPPADFGR